MPRLLSISALMSLRVASFSSAAVQADVLHALALPLCGG